MEYEGGGWNVTRVPKQGTYMTKDDRWIAYSSPADIRDKGEMLGYITWDQCDQMATLFFIFWPFTTMEIAQ